MKQEGYVSTTKLVTDILWAIVVALIVAGWTIGLITRDYKIPIMLVGTASTASAAAVVAHIRCYTLRMANLIRVTAGLAPTTSEDISVHRIH